MFFPSSGIRLKDIYTPSNREVVNVVNGNVCICGEGSERGDPLPHLSSTLVSSILPLLFVNIRKHIKKRADTKDLQ